MVRNKSQGGLGRLGEIPNMFDMPGMLRTCLNVSLSSVYWEGKSDTSISLGKMGSGLC